MDPVPGAWTAIDGTEIKIFGARIVPGDPAPAGTIIAAANRLIVATGERGGVEVAEVQPAGKRRVTAAAWLRGAHLAADARFQ
jgi:methionyl-tRNA formyltransferase